ncbi:hypothetical protein THAOC_29388, partial [Thalassiosira oceanica]
MVAITDPFYEAMKRGDFAWPDNEVSAILVFGICSSFQRNSRVLCAEFVIARDYFSLKDIIESYRNFVEECFGPSSCLANHANSALLDVVTDMQAEIEAYAQ